MAAGARLRHGPPSRHGRAALHGHRHGPRSSGVTATLDGWDPRRKDERPAGVDHAPDDRRQLCADHGDPRPAGTHGPWDEGCSDQTRAGSRPGEADAGRDRAAGRCPAGDEPPGSDLYAPRHGASRMHAEDRRLQADALVFAVATVGHGFSGVRADAEAIPAGAACASAGGGANDGGASSGGATVAPSSTAADSPRAPM